MIDPRTYATALKKKYGTNMGAEIWITLGWLKEDAETLDEFFNALDALKSDEEKKNLLNYIWKLVMKKAKAGGETK